MWLRNQLKMEFIMIHYYSGKECMTVIAWLLSVPTLVALGGGCASTACKIGTTDSSVDLTKYTRCYVADAKSTDGVVVPLDVLNTTGDKIASELRGRKAFDDVLREPPPKDAPSVQVQTTYTSYRPGSRALRFLLIGLGTANLKMQVDLQDGQSGKLLATGTVHEFWGWGGIMGMSRGIEEMQKSAIKNVGQGIDKACRPKGRKR